MFSVNKRFRRISPFIGVDPSAVLATTILDSPQDLIARLSIGDGLVLATWDSSGLVGRVAGLGVVMHVDKTRMAASVEWRHVDLTLEPSPQQSGRCCRTLCLMRR